MQKYEIVNALVARYGYLNYLEICTPITGHRFSRIDRRSLQCCHRLMYRCTPDFQDGLEVTYRNESEHIGRMPDAATPYDIIFVDPFHTFECSIRDLHLAFETVRPGGTIVVHDCCPAKKEMCQPTFQPGGWCGVTYRAYIEFVLCQQDLAYYTVDTDYGCGVIKKGNAHQADPETRRKLWELWSLRKLNDPEMFEFFVQHRRELLSLISVRDFLARENASWLPLLRLAEWRDRFAAFCARSSTDSVRRAGFQSESGLKQEGRPSPEKIRVPRWCKVHSSRPVARV